MSDQPERQIIPQTRAAMEAEIKRLERRTDISEMRKKAFIEVLCRKLCECLCRQCGEKYDNRKARGDFKGFCGAACQHKAAKAAGYKKSGTRSEFACLKAVNNLGDVPTTPTE